jgi:hypothetical protein
VTVVTTVMLRQQTTSGGREQQNSSTRGLAHRWVHCLGAEGGWLQALDLNSAASSFTLVQPGASRSAAHAAAGTAVCVASS